MLPWSFSAHSDSFKGKSVSELVSICKQAGFAGVEGYVQSFSGQSEAELAETAAVYQAGGLKIDTFHLPFSPAIDPAAFYETQRREAVYNIRVWMDRANILGAGTGILHPGTSSCSIADEGVDPFMAKLDKSLGELLPAADALGMDLALENMTPVEGGRFGSYPEHFELFRERFGHPRLKFCLDTGHALMTMRERADEFFTAMGKKLTAFHLQDTPGYNDAHLAPGHGRVDWRKVFRGMAELGYKGIACIEARPFDFGPDWSIDAWCEMVADTNALAENALQN